MLPERIDDARRSATEFYIMHPPPFWVPENRIVGISVGALAHALHRAASIVSMHDYGLVPVFIENLRGLHVITFNKDIDVCDSVEAGFSLSFMYLSSPEPTMRRCSLEISARSAFHRLNYGGTLSAPRFSLVHRVADIEIWNDGTRRASSMSLDECLRCASEYILLAFGTGSGRLCKSVRDLGDDDVDIGAVMRVHDMLISSAEAAVSSIGKSYEFNCIADARSG